MATTTIETLEPRALRALATPAVADLPYLSDDAASWAHEDAPSRLEDSELFDVLGLAGERAGWLA